MPRAPKRCHVKHRDIGCPQGYLKAEQIVWVVPSDFASLHHKVFKLFVDFSWRVLPREQITYGLGTTLKEGNRCSQNGESNESICFAGSKYQRNSVKRCAYKNSGYSIDVVCLIYFTSHLADQRRRLHPHGQFWGC